MIHHMNLERDVRRIIDDYLDAIEAALQKSRLSRAERQSIVENVDDQISEMLNSRGIASPTEADVRALLAELDSPESYAESVESTANGQTLASQQVPGKRRLSFWAVVGALWAIVFFTCVPLFFVARVATPGNEPSMLWIYMARALLFAGISAPLGTTLFGIIAIGQIRNSQGKRYGMGLAIADSLLFPLMAALPVCIIASNTVIAVMKGDTPSWAECVVLSPASLTVGCSLWLVVAGLAVWKVRRWATTPATDG